jgi:hypothetical protein
MFWIYTLGVIAVLVLLGWFVNTDTTPEDLKPQVCPTCGNTFVESYTDIAGGSSVSLVSNGCPHCVRAGPVT